MITLNAKSDYGFSGQHIARISGLDQKSTFVREFIGRKTGKRGEATFADVEEPGLYEVCDVTKDGNRPGYVLVLEFDQRLRVLLALKEDALEIAREMDLGQPFGHLVAFCPANVEAMRLAANIRDMEKLNSRIPSNPGTDLVCVVPCDVGAYQSGQTVPQAGLRLMLLEAIEDNQKRLDVLLEDGKSSIDTYETFIDPDADKAVAPTVETAVKGCWRMINELSREDARQVLGILKAILN
jgi:hypothetical protein